MKNERKQLEIMVNQLKKALDIIENQKYRYENLNTSAYGYTWRCEDADKDNEIANGLLQAMGGIECAIENIYN